MDLDCGGESVGGMMQAEEEMGREKSSAAAAANHNHYTSKFLLVTHLGLTFRMCDDIAELVGC